MLYKSLLFLILAVGAFFSGACTTITTAGPWALDGSVYNAASAGGTCILVNLAAPTPAVVYVDLHGSTITNAVNNVSGIDVVRNGELSVVIENGTINNSYYAVSINGISVTLRNVTITNSGYGIYINTSSENNTFANVSINNADIGIYSVGYNNSMTNITISNSTKGILLNSANNTLRNVTITNTYYAFDITETDGGGCKAIYNLYNNIDNTTTIDGRPIYYSYSPSNLHVGRNMANFGDPSAVYIINGTNVTVENITSQYLGLSFFAAWGNNLTFSNVTSNETYKSISICDAHNVTVKNSRIGAYGSSLTNADGRTCGFNSCATAGIYVDTANNTNISDNIIKNFYYDLSLSSSHNNIVSGNTMDKGVAFGISGAGLKNTKVTLNNLSYASTDSRTSDTKKTTYGFLSPITPPYCSSTYACVSTGIGLGGDNLTIENNRVHNASTGNWFNGLYNSTVHNLYVSNSNDSIYVYNSINVTINYSTITNNSVRTGASSNVDFRSVLSYNISLYNLTLSPARISLDFTGNLSVNSSFNITASPTVGGVSVGDYTGVAVNVSNESTVTANLTIYHPSGYNSMSVFRHPANDTTSSWVNVSNDPGVTYTADYTSGYFKMVNLTNFSIYAIFGSKIIITPVVPTSNPVLVPPKPQISLSISRTCPGGDIVVSSEKGASITLMYSDGWSDFAKIGDSGSVSFPKRGEGTITVMATHSDYSSTEKKFDYANCPVLGLTVSGGISCPGSTATLTVTSSDGVQIEGAAVKITSSDGVSKSGTTDSNGKAIFQLSNSGTYLVEATKDGYEGYRSSNSYSLCALGASWSLRCPEKKLQVSVISAGQPVSGAEVRYGSESAMTDASGGAALDAYNGTTMLQVTASGYSGYDSSVSLDSPCYVPGEQQTKPPEQKPEEKPGEKPEGKPEGGTTSKPGSGQANGQTKPSEGAATVVENVNDSLGKLKDAVAELTDTNEKKIAAVVIIVIAGFLAYNYFVSRNRPYKPKVKESDD